MTSPETTTGATAFRESGAAEWRNLVAENNTSDGDKQDVRIAKDALKNALLASLQMQNLVVLAGSGCSLSAGGPSMQDLWTWAIRSEPAKASEAARKVNHDLTNQNIEAFLSRIEAFLHVNSDKDVSDFLNASKRAILDQCTRFLDMEKLDDHISLLHRLSRRRVRDQRLRVFTTNYDLCFERAAAALGGVALDGFSFAAPRRYDPRYFGYDIIRRPRSGDDLGHYVEGVFLLYKLHGSVNWARDEDGAIYERDNPSPSEACLIYPATGKYQQSFIQPHLESMAQYLAAVREPNTCLLTIGVGFNDDHLGEPLLAAVKSNPHLRMIVVDPEADTKATNGTRYWKELAELSGRGEDVWFIKASFRDFAQMVPDLKSLTPADTLMKALKNATRES